MTRTTLLLMAVVYPALVAAQVGCLPPEEPFPYAPPQNDPELRAIIDEQYQEYLVGTETYLNCLNAESNRVRNDYQTIIDRYLRYFGDEAGIELDAPG